jgi:uncharacterized membrane protein YphA (DoxX/SURF4 family)
MMPQPAYNQLMWARRILGLVLVAMGAGKLSDVAGYAQALVAFRVIPSGALHAVAWAWLAAELIAGALLLAGIARAGAALALVINLGYAALTTQAFARHLAIDNCTCFGVHLRQHLGWFVLVQDAYMIAFSVYVYVAARRSTRRAPAGSPAR